jgi:hypothetical protein
MSATGAVTLDASKIITTFDIDKPEVRAQFFRIRGNQGMNFFLTDALARNYSEGEHHQRSFGRSNNSLSRN